VHESWPDEQAFQAADPRRRQSAEVDLGATWRWSGSADAHRVAWLCETGELYLCKADAYDGSCSDVGVARVLPAEQQGVEQLLGGHHGQHADDGLDWLSARLELIGAA
jgi:hypothetical protein